MTDSFVSMRIRDHKHYGKDLIKVQFRNGSELKCFTVFIIISICMYNFAVSTLENSLTPIIKAYFEPELIDVKKKSGSKCETRSSIMYQMPTYVSTSSA